MSTEKSVLLGTVTITRVLDEDDDRVYVDATTPDGEVLAVIEVLGMLELAKSIVLGTGGDE